MGFWGSCFPELKLRYRCIQCWEFKHSSREWIRINYSKFQFELLRKPTVVRFIARRSHQTLWIIHTSFGSTRMYIRCVSRSRICLQFGVGLVQIRLCIIQPDCEPIYVRQFSTQHQLLGDIFWWTHFESKPWFRVVSYKSVTWFEIVRWTQHAITTIWFNHYVHIMVERINKPHEKFGKRGPCLCRLNALKFDAIPLCIIFAYA